jgi:hypothetical protein
MKKNQFLRVLTIAMVIVAVSLGTLNFSSAQSIEGGTQIDYATGLSPNNSSGVSPQLLDPIGCYTYQILNCGFELGDQLFCNFTGSYGPPYQCTSLSCYGTKSTRHCVQGN